jgi:hypothetical protein
MQWYSLGVYAGKEKLFKQSLESRIKEEPPMEDPTTGEDLSWWQVCY